MNNQEDGPNQEQKEVKQIVVFVLDNEHYAVPIHQVKEVIRSFESSPVPGSPAYVLGVMNLRGQVIPVIDLEVLFDLHRTTPVVMSSPIIVVEDDQARQFGVHVDRVLQIMKVSPEMIKPAPTVLATKILSEYVEGVIVIPSGGENQDSSSDLLLLLNVQKIVSEKHIGAAVSDVDQSNVEASQPQQKEE